MRHVSIPPKTGEPELFKQWTWEGPMNADKTYPIEIHFKGRQLEVQSVPIYELGETLLSIQRMVMQAYLIAVDNEKQKKKDHAETPDQIQHRINQKEVREGLSLRLAGQARGSDAYLLEWFNSAAAVIAPHLLNLALGIVFESGLKYMAKRVIVGGKVHRGASLLFNEFLVLSNRIERVGDIDSIEIYVQDNPKPIVIDSNTKEYITRIREVPVLENKIMDVEGRVVTAHILSHEYVDIYPVKPAWLNQRIRVDMAGTEFDGVLTNSIGKRNALFKFTGSARLRPGDDPKHFREFKADRVTPVKKTKKGKKKVMKRTVKPAVQKQQRSVVKKTAPRKMTAKAGG